MVKHRNPSWLVVALVGACAADVSPHAAAPQQSDTRTLVGKPAPPFALHAISGSDSADLAGLAGHVVLVDFWASWCKPCTASVPLLNAWRAKYDVRIIGVSSDDANEIAHYATQNQVGFTVAHDDGEKVAAAYLVGSLPTLVVIDKTGIVRYIDVGARDLTAVETEVVGLIE